MKNRGFRECYTPFNHSLNDKAFVGLNINKEDSNFYLRIPIFSSKSIYKWSYDLIYYVNHEQQENNHPEMYPFRLRDNLFRQFSLTNYSGNDDYSNSKINMNDIDGRIIEFNYHSYNSNINARVFANSEGNFAYYYPEDGSFDYCEDGTTDYYHTSGQLYPTRVLNTEIDTSSIYCVLNNNGHFLSSITSINNFKLEFIYDPNTLLVSRINIFSIKNDSQSPNQFVLCQYVAFSYSLNLNTVEILYYDVDELQNDIFRYSITIHFLDSSNYIWIEDDLTHQKNYYHFTNGRCDYFYRKSSNFNVNDSMKISLGYYDNYTIINDFKGRYSRLFFDDNRLPYMFIDEDGVAFAIKCDNSSRTLINTSRAFNIKSYNRIVAENNLISNGFFDNGANNWLVDGNYYIGELQFVPYFQIVGIYAKKITQLLDYQGIPNERFSLFCCIQGAFQLQTESENCAVKVTLIDYFDNELESFFTESIFKSHELKSECLFLPFCSNYAFSKIKVEIGTESSSRLFLFGSIQLVNENSFMSIEYDRNNKPYNFNYENGPSTIIRNELNQPIVFCNACESAIYGDYVGKSKNGFKRKKMDYGLRVDRLFGAEREILYKINDLTRFSQNYIYTENGFLLEEKTNGITSRFYTYNSIYNIIEEDRKDCNGIIYLSSLISYELNGNGKVFSLSFCDSSSILSNTILFDYDYYGLCSSITSECGQYNHLYSPNFKTSSVSLNSITIINYLYNSYEDLTGVKYGTNSAEYVFSYDSKGLLSEINYCNNLIHSFSYDDCNRLMQVDDYVYRYIGNECCCEQINNSEILTAIESPTCIKKQHNLLTERTYDYLIYTSDAQYIYKSRNHHLASIYACRDLSFVIFGLSNFIYSSNNDETLLTMHGKYYIPSSEYTSIDGITLINYSGLNYKVLQSKSTYGNQNLPFTKALCYGWNCPYQDGNQGETIGGYFNFSQLEYGNLPTFFMFLTNSGHTESIGLTIENNYIYCVVSGSGGSVTDIINGVIISTNTWYYISLSAYFENNYLRKIRIRINDKVSYINYNLSSPYSNDGTNTIRFVSFFGINDNIAPSGASCQTMDGYSLCLFISPNHKYLSDDEERSVYITAKTAFFDTNFDDHKRISSSVFMKKQTPYPLTIISKKHIPLCNSFVSLEGDRPVLAKHNHELNLYNNSTFRFNESSHQYSYYACGYDLAYQNINVITGFSISLNINLDNINTSNPRYIFEIKNTSNSLGVYVQNGTIYCKYNSNNPIQLCTVSSIGDNRFSFYYVIPLRPLDVPGIGYYSNNESNFISISSFNGINGGLISFGRKLEEETLVDGTKTSYPLYGFIDSIAMANVDDISETRDENSNIGLVKKNYIENFETQKNSDEIYIDNSFLSERTIDVATSTSDTNPGLPKSEYLDLSTSNGLLSNYGYDSCHRLNSVTRGNSSDGETFINQTVKTYTYDAFSRLIGYNINNSNKPKTYLYDSHGNITHIKENLTNKKVLTYDSLNRLTKEGNVYNFRYESSNPFNITFFGMSLMNDDVGNYFSYQGRLLTDITVTDSSPLLAAFPEMHFVYDYKIRRTRKTVGGLYNKIHSYIYDDNRLIFEIIFESDFQTVVHEIKYFYDEKGILSYMEIDDSSKYFYYIDSFSNIVGLYDENGVMVVRYEYDPWGNVESIVDNSNISLSTLNPFLYKCYYYDHESKMYYCHSRYYVPRWMRWLTIDSLSFLNPKIIGQTHLYSYCSNNPIMNKDENGTELSLALMIAIAAAIGFAGGFGIKLISEGNKNNWRLTYKHFIDASICGVFSAFASVFTTVEMPMAALLISVIGAGIVNVYEYVTINNKEEDETDMLFDLAGAVTSFSSNYALNEVSFFSETTKGVIGWIIDFLLEAF